MKALPNLMAKKKNFSEKSIDGCSLKLVLFILYNVQYNVNYLNLSFIDCYYHFQLVQDITVYLREEVDSCLSHPHTITLIDSL